MLHKLCDAHYLMFLHAVPPAGRYGPRYAEKPFTIETVTVEQILDQKEEPVNKDKL